MRHAFHHRNSANTSHLVKRILFSPIGLFFWIFFCTALSIGLWQSVAAMRQSLTREQQAKHRLEEEEKKALQLIDKLNKADTPLAKEKIIRDELQMQKPGETVLQIPED